MKILDYNMDVRDLILSGVAAVDRLLPRFRTARSHPSEYLDDASPDLVALLSEVYQLRRFARLGAPHIQEPGGSGSGLDAADAPTIMSAVEGKETWDFQPWLAEKIRTAEGLIFRVCDICVLDVQSGVGPGWRGLARYDDPGAECCRLLEGVRACFDLMLGLIDSGELKICQLTVDDDEDDDEDDDHDRE